MKYFYVIMAFLMAAPLNALAAEQRFVRVTADAEVMAPPNRVTITLGTQYQTNNLKDGAQVLQKNITQALDYCRTWNIKDKNIQIQSLNITPSYYAPNGKRTDKPSYMLSQSFSVTLEDLTQYENLLYGLLKNGVNRVQDVRFYSSRLKDYRNEARTLAMQNAREKATLLALQEKAKLGKVMSIVEERPSAMYGASNISQNAYFNTSAGAPVAGVIPVRAEVTVQYELK